MAEELGIKVRVEPGSSAKDLNLAIEQKYSNKVELPVKIKLDPDAIHKAISDALKQAKNFKDTPLALTVDKTSLKGLQEDLSTSKKRISDLTKESTALRSQLQAITSEASKAKRALTSSDKSGKAAIDIAADSKRKPIAEQFNTINAAITQEKLKAASLTSEIELWSSEIKNGARALSEVAKSTDQQTKSQKSMGAAIDANAEKLNKISQIQKSVTSDTSSTVLATDTKIGGYQEHIESVIENESKWIESQAGVASSLDTVVRTLDEAISKVKEYSSGIKDIGKSVEKFQGTGIAPTNYNVTKSDIKSFGQTVGNLQGSSTYACKSEIDELTAKYQEFISGQDKSLSKYVQLVAQAQKLKCLIDEETKATEKSAAAEKLKTSAKESASKAEEKSIQQKANKLQAQIDKIRKSTVELQDESKKDKYLKELENLQTLTAGYADGKNRALFNLSDLEKSLAGVAAKTADATKKQNDEIAAEKALEAQVYKTSKSYEALVQGQEKASKRYSVADSKGYLTDDSKIKYADMQTAMEKLDAVGTALNNNRTSDTFNSWSDALNKAKLAMDAYNSSAKESEKFYSSDTATLDKKIKSLDDFVLTLKNLKVQGGTDAFSEIQKTIDLFEKAKSKLSEAYSTNNYKVLTDFFKEVSEGTDNLKFAGKEITNIDELMGSLAQRMNSAQDSARGFNDELKKNSAITRNKTALENLTKQVERYLDANKRVGDSPAIASQFDRLKKSMQELENVTDPTLYKQKLDSIRGTFVQLQNQAHSLGLEGKSLAEVFESLFGQHLSTAVAMGALHLMQNSLRQIYQNVVDVDSAMTELKKVTNETGNTYDRFLNNAGTRAQALGATVSDVVNATADFARLGNNLADSTILADAASVYKNVGDGISDISEASESIISTMKAFGIQAEDSMSIVDKFNETGNNFAISSQGVGVAMQKSASALKEAGNTIDESIGLIVAANDTVQNPEEVGTALKTLSLRIRGAKAELEDAGEDVTDMCSSTSELQEKLKALTGNKVDIMLNPTTFKSTYEIMKEMSAVWDSMTDVNKASALELLGGKRQANILSSVITNWKDSEAAATGAADSAGSALAENEQYLDSINGKISQFTAAFQTLSTDLLDSGIVKNVVGFGTGLLQAADGATKLGVALPIVVSSISAILSAKNVNGGKVNMPAVEEAKQFSGSLVFIMPEPKSQIAVKVLKAA